MRNDRFKFLADECCDTEIVSSLRENGHDVIYNVWARLKDCS